MLEKYYIRLPRIFGIVGVKFGCVWVRFNLINFFIFCIFTLNSLYMSKYISRVVYTNRLFRSRLETVTSGYIFIWYTNCAMYFHWRGNILLKKYYIRLQKIIGIFGVKFGCVWVRFNLIIFFTYCIFTLSTVYLCKYISRVVNTNCLFRSRLETVTSGYIYMMNIYMIYKLCHILSLNRYFFAGEVLH